MKTFLDENFLLQSDVAEQLYHQYAAKLPIIDYHNHLPPEQVAKDQQFSDLTEIWLDGDHYKWRAMRANGISEHYITGKASNEEKFNKWAETVPYTLRNPLFHWTHLELQRYFSIDKPLNPQTAKVIYQQASAALNQKEMGVHGLLNRMSVEVICTTDDPTDDLKHHQAFSLQNQQFRMFPAFRPDKAMNPENPHNFNEYVNRLEIVSNQEIRSFSSYLEALKSRHDYFAAHGCCISDHGLSNLVPVDNFTHTELEELFAKLRANIPLNIHQINTFRWAMLVHFAHWDHEKGWVQQYHLGAFRNTNSRAFQELGADTGFDSIGDFSQGLGLWKFLDLLAKDGKLTKTILYNLNGNDNDLFAAMAGNFNDGEIAGKIQFGSAWWYNDQKEGMTKQINSLSNIGLISKFIGMLTDSRSFLSFPRHEYFRRLLCNIFAQDIISGELPRDMDWIGKIIQDICYYNAKAYFPFAEKKR